MGHPKSKFPTRILLYLSNIKIDEKKVTKTGVEVVHRLDDIIEKISYAVESLEKNTI